MVHCPTEFLSSSPEETENFGEQISRILKPGSVIALQGCLGAGKTCLVKGIARGLGINEIITSPTYTIINEYNGNCPLYHIDAYRLAGDDDFRSTGAGEYIGSRGLTVIEWSERIPKSIPENSVKISIEITGTQNRVLHIEGMENT